ncbi:MAG: chemotaxis protein CheA [bacterium]|nr:chemotaxis protein CheA [bacterium]
MDMSKYKGMFISETKEHLQTMNSLIISLEKNPEGKEDIEALFREAHSIKGMAASMGYDSISDLSHKMEDMMDLFRKGELNLDSELVDILFQALDSLEIMLKSVEADQPVDAAPSTLIASLQAIKGGTPTSSISSKAPAPSEKITPPAKVEEDNKKAAAPITPEGQNLQVDLNIDPSSQIPGMRAFLIYKALSEAGTITISTPDIEDVKKGNFDNKFSLHISTEKTVKEIKKILAKMTDLAGFSVNPLIFDNNAAVKSSASSASEIEPAAVGAQKPSQKKSQQIRTVRVTTDLLDNLINIVGEMIISRSRLIEVSKGLESNPLQDGMLQMSNLIRDLHSQVMSVRMTPIENLMERLPRVVRDLARKSGKKIDLKIDGKDIELDRAIVDEMADPLVHVLRNCVDHGIETVFERELVGKNGTGQIRIRAMREKDQVYINIEDDGKGMDTEKIKRKAIARGLIKKERIATIPDKEVFMMVCHSGLSTAEKVTDVSGRGVGMDAVKSVVDSVGGSLEIDSILGKGTSITLKLPLTVAIVHVLLVGLGDETLAIPINKIIRTLEVEKHELKRSQKQMAILIDNEMIPLLSLKKVLDIKSNKAASDQISIVIVEMKSKKVGLVVDGFIEQQEAFVKPLEAPLEWIKGLSGATILGDGSVIFVLDIPNLL